MAKLRFKRYIYSVFFLSLIALILFLIPRLIVINKISCRSEYGACPSEMEKSLYALQGKNINEVRQELKLLLKNSEIVESYSYQYKLPFEIEVNITISKSYYAVSRQDRSMTALIDADGKVVSLEKGMTLMPTVISSENIPNVGDTLSPRVFFASILMNRIFEKYQVREGFIENDSFRVELLDGNRAIFPLNGDVDKLMSSISVILTKLNSREEDIRIENVINGNLLIDLRFINPVLSPKNKK